MEYHDARDTTPMERRWQELFLETERPEPCEESRPPALLVWCSACPFSLFLHRLCAGLSRPLNSDRDYQTSELKPPITEPLADCLPRFHWNFVRTEARAQRRTATDCRVLARHCSGMR